MKTIFELPDDFTEHKVRQKIKNNRFGRYLGFVFTRIAPGLVEGYLPLSEMHLQQNGYVHGGVMSAICDMVAGFAAFTVVEPHEQVLTAEIKISYFRAGKGERMYARGWVEKKGRQFVFCESETFAIIGEQKKVFAKASTTMAINKDTHPPKTDAKSHL